MSRVGLDVVVGESELNDDRVRDRTAGLRSPFAI